MAVPNFGTPARPVPGIYPQTPAPKTPLPPPSFGTSTSQFAQALTPRSRQAEPPAAPSTRLEESLKPAERAARAINEAQSEDARFPELDQYLAHGTSSEYEIPASPSWAPFQKVRVHQIPERIFDQFNRAQVSTAMGLFAELKHAWVAIDNGLYMWDYTQSNPELLGFEDQSHNITAVELAVPRAGVFLPTVKRVIVLATTVDIMLLGLGTDPSAGDNALTVFSTGMSASVRSLDVSTIAHSAKQGRIFFGGRTENDIYELSYQQQDGWFRGKCSSYCHTRTSMQTLTMSIRSTRAEHVEQIVVDDTRDLLYALSSNSTIRVFHMKSDGSLNLSITKSPKDIYSAVSHLVAPNETLNERIRIISISPIPVQEAARFSLIATTATGYRIYFSTTNAGYWGGNRTGIPVSMQPQHIKVPPHSQSNTMQQNGYAGQQQMQHISNPVKSLTSTRLAWRLPPGYFFCFVSRDPNSPTDNLFISAPDAGHVYHPPESGRPSRSAETAVWLDLDSRAEDLGVSRPYNAPFAAPHGFGNELAIQFDQPIPEITILTNTGIHVIKKRRLVDIFASLIRQGGGSDGFQGDINTLMRAYGRTETLSTALAVACGQGMDVSQDARSMRIVDPEVLEVARKTFIDHGGRPTLNQNAITDRNTPLIDAVRPSPRYFATLLYVSRLIRSAWKKQIAAEQKTPTEYQVAPAVPLDKLRAIQEDLSSLQRFFNTNKAFIKGLSGPDDLPQTGSRDDEIALQGEHRALHSIVSFVSHAIEALSFVLVLFEERVADIVPLLPAASRPEFFSLTFEELFSTQKGIDIAKELVKAIINRNIAKGSNVETVAEAIRRRCGNFCSADDVVIFKAQEQLNRAGEAGTNAEVARNLLNESLRLFEEVAHSMPNDFLQSAIKQYIDLKFFAGAIQLMLKVAHERDKGNDALSWMADGRPTEDPRKDKFDQRSRCYDLVHDVILAVDKGTGDEPTFLEGRPTLAAIRRGEAYDVISHSNDEVFLTNLYDWYLSQGWHDRVLATESPFIAKYLQRKSTDDIAYADLLWRYYGQTHQYQEAAKVQLDLAQSTFNLPLDRRIEYLSRARANASTYSQGGNRKTKQKLLADISELIDIANIQDELLQRLKSETRLPRESRQEVLDQVDGPILDISTLFNKYANAAGYYDVCLMIYQVADHRDGSAIKQTWQQLLQQTHDDTVAAGEPMPFEAIAEQVRMLGGKLRLSENTFPVPMLLPMLEGYSSEHQRDVAAPHWVISLFLDLGVTYEEIFDVLETMFYTDEGGPVFEGRGKGIVVKESLCVVKRWWGESTRVGGGTVLGGQEGCRRVMEYLEGVLSVQGRIGLEREAVEECRLWVAKISEVID